MNKHTFFLFAYWHDRRYRGVVDASIKIFDLAGNLKKSGHRVILFVPRCRAQDLNVTFKVVEIPIIELPVLRYLFFFVFSFLAALLISFKLKPDIVYYRRMMSILPVVLARLRRARVILEINDDFMAAYKNYQPRSLKLAITRWIDRFNLKHSDGISVITENLKNRIHRDYGVSLDRMVVLPSCSDTGLFKPLDSMQCRRELQLQADIIYIGFVGAMLPWKGLDALFTAARDIVRKNENISFLLVGEGVMKAELQAGVTDDGLAERFIFTGQVPYADVSKYINCMDICTAPYTSSAGEISPVKIFDSLACGKPVVASNTVGEIILESGGVIAVPPDDHRSLTRALMELVNDEDLRHSMGRRGRSWVVENYDRSKVAETIIGMANDFAGSP